MFSQWCTALVIWLLSCAIKSRWRSARLSIRGLVVEMGGTFEAEHEHAGATSQRQSDRWSPRSYLISTSTWRQRFELIACWRARPSRPRTNARRKTMTKETPIFG